jgi:hypothetical protein
MANLPIPFVNPDLPFDPYAPAPPPVLPGARPSSVFVQPAQDAGAPPSTAIARMAAPAPSQVFAAAPEPVTRQPTPLEDQIGETDRSLKHFQWQDANPYGSATNHPGIGGKILHALSVAGNIAGDIFAPSTTALIPGTELNRRVQEGGLSSRLQDLTREQSQDEASDAATAKTQAETAGLPEEQQDKHDLSAATTGNLTSEAKDRDLAAQNPSLAVAYSHAVQQAINAGRDPQQDPIVQHLSDAIVSLQPGQNKNEARKTIQVEVNGKPHQMAWNPKTSKYDLDQGETGEKPPVVNVNAGLGALDRETKQFGAPLQKSLDSANAQLEKIADARAMINGNAESQGLGIPKVLTALVGGQGTGVRITQAELTAIAHARGLSGDVEGTINKWAGKGALSAEQKKQLTQIMDDVRARILQKQSIASDTLDRINGASTREQIIQADKDARQKLSALENGGGGTQDFTVNGKTYRIPADQVAEFKKDHPDAK